MLHLLECAGHLSADALSRAVRPDLFRVLHFIRLYLANELVVFLIRDCRFVQHIVSPVCLPCCTYQFIVCHSVALLFMPNLAAR